MTDASMDSAPVKGRLTTVDARTRKRNAAEKRFKAYGLVAILIGLFFLVVLAVSILRSGLPAFTQAEVQVEFTLTQEEFDAAESQMLKTRAYEDLFIAALQGQLEERGLEVAFDPAAIERLLGKTGGTIREFFLENPDRIGTPVTFDLAASRAIGETMIVVLGAGAAARLSLNPFEAMTTVTAKIVSQLTGDADFASPEALVAFALGMTLFVITLGLNVLALYIVRKYREQYE